jgi:hypothetical protein
VEEITALIILATVIFYVAIRLIIFWKSSHKGSDRDNR